MLAVFIAFLVILRWWRQDKELYQTNWKVKHSDLVLDEAISSVARYNDELVAVQRIEKKSVREDKALLTEMKKLKSMCHTNLTTFVGAITDPQHISAVWEHCAKGPLEDLLLRPDSKMDTVRKLSISMDICNGLLYLHNSSIGVHGNLSISSIVVDSHWMAKITDFGLTRLKQKEKKNKTDDGNKMAAPFKVIDFLKRLKFHKCRKKEKSKEKEHIVIKEESYKDLYWTSPERLRFRLSGNKEIITKESDVYSLGVILKQVMCQNAPYEELHGTLTAKEIITKVAYPQIGTGLMRPHIPEDVGRQSVTMATCKQLIRSCWSEAVAARSSVRKIVRKLKRLSVIKDKNVWEVMTIVKKRYSAKLGRLIDEDKVHRQSNSTMHQTIPSSIQTGAFQGQGQEYAVTVCFWSVVDFTTIAIQNSTVETLQMLKGIDDLVEKVTKRFQVCQIDTVCDSSMLVSRCPASNPDHASIMADASCAILDCVANNASTHSKLFIRIGLNSGAVVIGTVGHITPHICVFGNTVNVASRLEANSFPQKIHISSSTHKRLQAAGGFSMEPRDPLDWKGVDGQPSYWLNGRIQEIQESIL